MRKRRSDRTHIIYKITNELNNEFYIGITVLQGRAFLGSLQKRWKEHVSRAIHETRNWNLCNAIREYGPQYFKIEIFETIRGKRSAHSREIQLIRELKPQLNTSSVKC
jgi:group I intron endonuclease